MVTKVKLIIDDSSDSDVDSLIDYLETTEDFILEDIRQIEELNPLFHQPLPRIERKYRTIDSFEETEVRQLFRFESKEQLRRLLQGFRFPEQMISSVGNKFTGEEVLLCGIFDYIQ
jgi:hypothetical protein